MVITYNCSQLYQTVTKKDFVVSMVKVGLYPFSLSVTVECGNVALSLIITTVLITLPYSCNIIVMTPGCTHQHDIIIITLILFEIGRACRCNTQISWMSLGLQTCQAVRNLTSQFLTILILQRI